MAEQIRKPFHQQVADKLIEQIQAGTAPWQKPWVPGQPIMPVNPTTGKRYRGVNVLMLMMEGHSDPRWMTFNQAQKAGYQVKRGEHGTPVQFWVFTERVPKLDPVTGQPELDARGNPVKVEVELEKPKVIISRVFNATQIDGIPPPQMRKGFDWDPLERAEDILANSGVSIAHDQADRAYYMPALDAIHLPARDSFPDTEKYYDTAMHEYAHATGHESRLNRDMRHPFGSDAYAREELVAQIASFMLCAEVGIQPDMNRNAAYVGNWVRELKNHPMEICKAAQQAERVLTYVMERERERHPERDPAQAEKATPDMSPRLAVERFLHCRDAIRSAADNPEAVHVFEHEGNKLYALKSTETLYSVPGHMPTAGEHFDVQTRVAAYDGRGAAYNVILRESLVRQPDGGNEVRLPKEPQSIEPANMAVELPLDWTGELTVKGCAEDREGNITAGVPDAEAEFYGVYAVREDGTELRVRDFDARDNAQGYADTVTGEFQRQTGRKEPEESKENRQYIDVPYPDRREARALGAAWDREAKSWYVSPGAETGKLTVKWQVHDPAATRAGQEAKQVERAAAVRDGAPDKIYINVPRVEKGTAKELGARWDRNAVSWYVPVGVNPEPLTAKWPTHAPAQENAQGKAVKVYLTVPYKEKDAAKAAGARWDKAEVRWYAAPGADMEKLAKWRQEERAVQEPTPTPREEFAVALKGIGARVEGEHPVMDKKPHRIEVDGDKAGERSGFYVLHGDGKPAGYCKNNRTQAETHFVAKGYILDDADRKALQDKARETLAKRGVAREKTHNRTADKLEKQLRNLSEPGVPTPYLAAKGIQIHAGVFASGQTTCIPAYNIDGKVRSMQYIAPDGSKRFAKDSRREGCFHPVGGMDALRKAPAIVIAEGYATAASVKEALGHAVVAAFDAGNLVPVAQAIHHAMPDKPIIIAGDDDKHLEAAGKANVGREKALEAAEAVGGKAVFPVFAPGERDANPKGFTDFNDLANKSVFGLDAVKSQIGSAVERQVEKRQAAEEQAKTREREERQRGGKEASRI